MSGQCADSEFMSDEEPQLKWGTGSSGLPFDDQADASFGRNGVCVRCVKSQ